MNLHRVRAKLHERRSLRPGPGLSNGRDLQTNHLPAVMPVLNLKADTVEISVSPNKPNIKFVVSKVHSSIEIAICWLVDGLNTKQKAFPRTIIYCRTIKDTACLFQYITTEIPECIELVDMYHSLTPSVQKDKIMEGLRSPTGTLRLVIATSALGMGIDIVSFYSVVVFGLSDTLVDLLQEIGRVGRDRKPSAALLLYNSYHLRSVGKEVKEITMCTGCRKEAIMSSFLNPEDREKLKETTRVHACCDACATHCACGVCSSLPIEDMFYSIDGCEDANDSADSDVTFDYQCISDFDDSFDIDL
ncbi:bifunctional 3'-5' exonuclease/ATP-dependent helicase WRN-like [Haliotis cracherodii]|uniref:bifunctional 3'-5' exonuclease/ATP-dependent helicase WRN-like n=1 Tax=Haliotis cracherodii TaxID=6455 RepID=UPI0039EA9329